MINNNLFSYLPESLPSAAKVSEPICIIINIINSGMQKYNVLWKMFSTLIGIQTTVLRYILRAVLLEI